MNSWNSLLRMQEEREQDRKSQDLRIRNSGVPSWNKPLPQEKRVKRGKPHVTPNINLKPLTGWLDGLKNWLLKLFRLDTIIEDLEGETDATGNNDTQ